MSWGLWITLLVLLVMAGYVACAPGYFLDGRAICHPTYIVFP
jgi:hypothetical protein